MSKLFGSILVFILACMPAAAQTLFALQPHPDEVKWPTAGWEIGSLPPEIEQTVGNLVVRAMLGEADDVMGQTRAVVIIHKGRLVAEAYKDDFTETTKQVSWSMAKSITQALVGRALQLGLIESIDEVMPTPFAPDDPRAAITWRQWMNMTDGLDYKEIQATSLADNDVVNMMYGRGKHDVLAYARDELPLAYQPGEVWNYSTAGLHLVSRALQDTIGITTRCSTAGGDQMAGGLSPVTRCSPSDVPTTEWMDGVLFAPLGMDAQPEFDTSGTFLGGSLVWASARDFAKFGYLYLRDGVWEGERLLPEGWVNFARTKTPADNANIYGAGWWITAYGETPTHPQAAQTPPWDAFHAGGHEGQTIWVVPSRDLVIVRLGLMRNTDENWGALYEWNQEIARAFPEATFAN